MTERRRHLDAILANPGDDLPRLVYADWLEENGESERAEYIRLAINNPHKDYYCRCDMCRHEVRLMVKLYEPLCPWSDPRDQYRVNRGFIAEIRGPLAALLEHGPAICAEHPVTAVEVTDREPTLSAHAEYNAYCWYRADGMARPFDIHTDVIRHLYPDQPNWIVP